MLSLDRYLAVLERRIDAARAGLALQSADFNRLGQTRRELQGHMTRLTGALAQAGGHPADTVRYCHRMERQISEIQKQESLVQTRMEEIRKELSELWRRREIATQLQIRRRRQAQSRRQLRERREEGDFLAQSSSPSHFPSSLKEGGC